MAEENNDPSLEKTEELGKSYGTFLDQQAWEVDAPEASLPTDSPEAPASGEIPAEEIEGPDASPADPPPVLRIIEALLFVGGQPLTEDRAAQILRGLTAEQFTQAIDTLNHTYRRQARPYAIQATGHGYVLTLRPRYQGVVEQVYGGVREARLSTAAIDVLSLVAYRQPATKAEIDSLRGAESGSLLRQLVRRGLVSVVYRGEAKQQEVSYGTTSRFLEFFGLGCLEDLPRTQDLQQL